jgi:hypothetical protein
MLYAFIVLSTLPMHSVSDVSNSGTQTAEPLHSSKVKRSAVIQQEVKHCHLKFINSSSLFATGRKCLIAGRRLLLLSVPKEGDKTNCGISLLLTSYRIVSNILLSRLGLYIDEIIGDDQCGFDITDQLLIRISAFVRYWRKNGSTMRQYIGYSDFKKAYDSVRREVLYNILISIIKNKNFIRL